MPVDGIANVNYHPRTTIFEETEVAFARPGLLRVAQTAQQIHGPRLACVADLRW